jgi:proteasome lid subunit RPN8/RPN11
MDSFVKFCNDWLTDRMGLLHFLVMIIPESVKLDISNRANVDKNEICGYWLPGSNQIIPATNIADDPVDSFRIDPDFHISVMARFPNAVIYPSHRGLQTASHLSYSDLCSSKALKIPYLVYHADFDEWDYFDPAAANPYPLIESPHPPQSTEFYIGMPWTWNRWDCYSVVTKCYEFVLGIKLQDFNRLGETEGSVIDDWNQFEENYSSQGFSPIEVDAPLKENDLIFIDYGGVGILHHVILVIDAEEMIGLHILGEGRLSCRVKLTEPLMRKKKIVARHRNFI